MGVPSYVLPRAQRRRLVLNVREMRLYYYPPRSHRGASAVHTYPVSAGRMGWSTPPGRTQIVEKTKNPREASPRSRRRPSASRFANNLGTRDRDL